MARRRIITQDISTDEDFNTLSMEAQLLFLRMLPHSDDCGVVPANLYTLGTLINAPEKIRKGLKGYLDEIVRARLGHLFIYYGKIFFAFKPGSFETHQSFVINKRTKSEYLRVSVEEFQELSRTFPDFPGNTPTFYDALQASIESISKSSSREGGVGGEGAMPPKATRLTNEAIFDALEAPEPFRTDVFRAAMLEWIRNRRGKGAPSGGWVAFFQNQINRTLSGLSHDAAVDMLSYSAEMGYQGLFARKAGNGSAGGDPGRNGYPPGYYGMHELESAKQKDPNLMSKIAICEHTDGRKYWTVLRQQHPLLEGFEQRFPPQ